MIEINDREIVMTDDRLMRETEKPKHTHIYTYEHMHALLDFNFIFLQLYPAAEETVLKTSV